MGFIKRDKIRESSKMKTKRESNSETHIFYQEKQIKKVW